MNKDELLQIVDGLSLNLDPMINQSPSCLKLVSANGKLIMMNKTGLDLIEAEDMDSVLGADVYSIVEESHREKFIKFNEGICSGKSGILTFEIVGLKGTHRWMETHASPYRLSNGKIAHIAITNDITELKIKRDVEEIITGLRQKYIECHSTPVIFFNYVLNKILSILKVEFGFLAEVVYDKETPYLRSYGISNISWNDESRKIYEENKELGLVFEDLNTLFGEVVKSKKIFMTNDPKNHKNAKGLPPGHPPLNSFLSVPLFQAGTLRATLGLANRTGGFSQELVDMYHPLFECVGELVGILQLSQENEKNEKKLRDLNNYLDLALEGSNIGIWEWNIIDNSVRFDKRYLEIIDFSLDEIEHSFEFWQSRVHPDDIDNCFKVINNFLEGKTKQFVNPHRMKHKNGHWVHVLATAKFSDWDAEGKPTRLTGTHIDISAQKKQELELVEARNKALLAEKAKTLFLANMSHEIRTPMNGVIGILDLLSETELDESQTDMIKTIQYCGQNLMTILNDILDLTKIESGKLKLAQSEFDLLKLLSETVSLFEAECLKKDIKLKFKNALNHHLFIGDITRIKQIISNLLSNAVKFTKNGGVEVLVTSKVSNDTNVNVEIIIRDSGIGIAPDVQKKLFSDFMQADDSITREYGGTGLGLSICKRLVHLMKGSIKVISELDSGSDFVVTLPLTTAENLPKKLDTNFFDGSMHHSLKVLIVEDNEINCKLIHAMMDKLNVVHDIVNDGQEAVKIIGIDNPQSFSVILMDLQMPTMDGYETAKAIFNSCLVNSPTIIPMTANVYDDDRVKCLAVGMTDFLPKPISLRSLSETLNRFVD